MANYFLTIKAVEDLSTIWDYIFEVWSENQADKYYFELLTSCQEIAENQNLGSNYEEINIEIFGYKSEQHLKFYRKLNENEVEIIGFLQARMDL